MQSPRGPMQQAHTEVAFEPFQPLARDRDR
jgi:hypothetical protein